jgi:predicted glycosyltransferase
LNIWIDVDNAPQARYLVPLADAFARQNHNVVITARNDGQTLSILEAEGSDFVAVGANFGRSTTRKVYGLLGRAAKLLAFHKSRGSEIDAVVTGSRAAVAVARALRIPSFVIIDYEYVNMLAYRIAGSYVLHPDVIRPEAFLDRGVRQARLIAFGGLKEDISFARIDVAHTPAHLFTDGDARVRILFRPAAETSHYFSDESRRLGLDLLDYLSRQDAQVVFSPRYAWQGRDLEQIPTWRHPPVILADPVPFVSLLKAVDAVVSAGGTMLREAAFLGVPAYSIFRSRRGAVDEHLAKLGRLAFLSSPDDFHRIRLERAPVPALLRVGPEVTDEIVSAILERTATRAS